MRSVDDDVDVDTQVDIDAVGIPISMVRRD